MMQTVGTPQYMPPMQAAAPSASAVNIQIFEPKAYATPQAPNYQAPIYSYPQQSVYMPQTNPFPSAGYMPQPVTPYQPPMTPFAPTVYTTQGFQPEQPVMPPYQPTVVTEPMPQPQQSGIEQIPSQPAQEPQAMPDPVINRPEASTQTAANPSGIDVNALVNGLQSSDTEVQKDAITKIANLSNGDAIAQSAVLTEPVMKGLADIVKQDTSGLQGQTEQQIAAINKAATGAQLTPEEEALAKQIAPKTAADTNRAISMFTLAMLQKNQRDEVDRYNQTQTPENQLPQVKINELTGYNEIENAAKNEPEPEIKLAAIQALSYIARPEDKETLEPIMRNALNDTEPLIQQAANEVLTNIGSQYASAAPTQQDQQVDVSQMSKKERKAYEKALKKKAKEEAKAEKKQK